MSPPPGEVARARPPVRGRAWQRLVEPRSLHWISLGAAAVFLLWVNRHQWFNADEWGWIIDRGVVGDSARGLLEPHNEHWSTMPILVWRALYTIFGVRTYTPYLLLVVTAHLVTVHLLWRLLLRIGVDALVATLACIPFAVLGAGWENLLWAFQFSIVTPLALGFAALLVVPDRGPLGRRDAVAVALLVFALMFPGAVTMVIVLGLFTLMTRGVRTAAAIVAAPAVVYLAWYAIWGNDPQGRPPDPFTTAVQKLPEFVWTGLTEAVDGASGLSGVGAVVLVLLGVFVVRRAQPIDPAWARVLAMAGGAIAFLALIGIRRTNLGTATAGSARYVYVVVALLLPLAALAADRLLRGTSLRVELLVLASVLLVGVQLSALKAEADRTGAIEQENKRRIIVAAELARDGVEVLAGTPTPATNPNLTMSELIRLDNDGKLPANVTVTPAERLTALAYLQVGWGESRRFPPGAPSPILGSVTGARTATGTEADCIDVTPLSPEPVVTLRFVEPASIEIVDRASGSIGVTLSDDRATGETRELALGEDGLFLNVNLEATSVQLTLPPEHPTTLCGVARS